MADRQGGGFKLDLDDGAAVLFLEGLASAAEAKSVSRELEKAFIRQLHRRGERHITFAIPPQLRLTIARGRLLEMQTTVDGRIVLQIRDDQERSPIILPKSW